MDILKEAVSQHFPGLFGPVAVSDYNMEYQALTNEIETGIIESRFLVPILTERK